MSTKRNPDTVQYLNALYGRCSAGDGEIILVESTKRRPAAIYRLHEIDLAVDEAQRHLDLYVKVNLMDCRKMADRLGGELRTNKQATVVGRRDEVKTIVSFHLDADAGKSSKYHTRDDVLGMLDAMPCKPSIIVNSDGPEGGFHPYWLLRSPVRIESEADRQRMSVMTTRWQERLKALAGGKIDSTANIDRLLRVPGTKRSNGNTVSIHEYHPDRLYDLDDLYIAPHESIETQAREDARKFVARVMRPLQTDGKLERAAKYLEAMEPAIAGANGHNATYKAACKMVLGFDLSVDEAFDLMADIYNPKCQPPWSDKELRRKCEHADKQVGERGYMLDRNGHGGRAA